MADSNRLGGVLFLRIDGTQYAARGNFTVMPSTVQRESIAGQDGVHGYTEKPIVPSIKGDLTTVPGLSVEALEAITSSTVMVQLANGKVYVLRQAWTKSAFEIDTSEGKLGIEMQGMSCDEV